MEDAPEDHQGQPRRGAPGPLKWKRFGGRTAVGSATLRLDYCPRGGSCPQNGKRVRVVASKPDYCKDSGKIEYLKLEGFVGKIAWFSGIISCSP